MKYNLLRQYSYVSKIVLVDGVAASGKAVIDNIVSTLSRVEITKVSKIIENICIISYLNLINKNSAETVIKTELDQTLYDLMMSRNLNFRPSDQTSVFKSYNKIKYLKRLFNKGDRNTPIDIRRQKPILHLLTHNLLGISDPLVNIFKDNITIIETVRHPKSVFLKQLDYMKKWSSNIGRKRQFNIWLNYNNKEIPWLFHDDEGLFSDLNLIEKVIFIMYRYNQIKDKFIVNNSEFYKNRCITIPFEHFIVSPWDYIQQIEDKLKTSSTKINTALNKLNIPRNICDDSQSKVVDGLVRNGVQQEYIIDYFYDLCNNYNRNYNLT